MFSQAVTTIQNFTRRKNRPSFSNYLADLGNFQDSEDLLELNKSDTVLDHLDQQLLSAGMSVLS